MFFINNFPVYFYPGNGQGGGGRGGQGGGFGRGSGGGGGQGRRLGPAGECVCTKCGFTVQHERGIPCNTKKCPECGSPMCRK